LIENENNELSDKQRELVYLSGHVTIEALDLAIAMLKQAKEQNKNK